MGDTARRIVACIAVENNIAEIYNYCSNRFDEARELFTDLSREEVNHVTILEVAGGYEAAGKLALDVVPVSLPNIYATLDFIVGVHDKVREKGISLADALDMALAMENSKVESYLLETLTKDTGDKVIQNLRKLLMDERSHIEKIEEFMKQMGL